MKLSALFVCVIVIAGPSQAYAYIDPGTGSVVTTAILGFLAAIGYTLRKYFYRLKDAIGGKKEVADADERTPHGDS